MPRKKPTDQSTPVVPKNLENDTSEEWQRFEEGARLIFSLPPEEAKRIREEYSAKGRKKKKSNS